MPTGIYKRKPLTEDHKRKLSETRKMGLSSGKIKHPKGMLGKHHTEEAKNKMREKRIGKKLTKETRVKMSNVKKGEKHHNWKGGRKAYIKRQRNNLKCRLNSRIRGSINNYLKEGSKNNQHWEDLVEYNIDQLKKRLESTMPHGYTWQDFLNGKLHIDHIIPVSVFNFSEPEHIDFKKCWNLNNLQLLPAKTNQKKYNKLENPFQPSMRLSL